VSIYNHIPSLRTALLAAAAALMATPPAAFATFPGEPGPIAFQRLVDRKQGTDQIFSVDPAGGPLQRLTAFAGGAKTPEFSPDGSRIAFYRPRPNAVFAMGADGSAPVRVTRGCRPRVASGTAILPGRRLESFSHARSARRGRISPPRWT
jgi:hypothetical protein